MKKSMIWLGPAFMGVVVAIVTVAILIATLVLSDDDSTQHTGTEVPAISETVEASEAPTEETPTEAAPTTPASVFGG
ncbi:MAG: hypothetical protein K8L91_03550 [Anaerolineae bacterium]|nr:hypothetical protein [Anaerolineae bacterium]